MKTPILEDTEALIFDCDGTLVDTLPSHLKAWEQIFLENDINLPISYLEQFNSCPSWMIVEDINKTLNLKLDPHKLADAKESLLFENMSEVRLIKPVLEYVENYYEKLPMAVISGGVKRNVIKSLEVYDLSKYFETIIAADDEHPPKTEPESFLYLAEKLKVSPNKCVVFEDGDVGIRSAIKAGMSIIDVRKDI